MTDHKAAGALPSREAPAVLHEDALRIFGARYPSQVRILDLGAGSGAWVRRLSAAGFHNLVAADHAPESYCGPAPFIRADLNQDFPEEFISPANGGWDVISAVEVIEHLESHAAFLRKCRQLLLQSNGELFLTSPNVECIPGRLKFLRTGKLRWFEGWEEPTHYTPVITCIFERLLRANGFEVAVHTHLPQSIAWNGTKRWKVPLCRLLSAALEGSVEGDCHLYILRPVALR